LKKIGSIVVVSQCHKGNSPLSQAEKVYWKDNHCQQSCQNETKLKILYINKEYNCTFSDISFGIKSFQSFFMSAVKCMSIL
jgi:hypothetical protein